MAEKRLIVGLGNPGKDYQYTRHNLGFLAVQKLAKDLNFKLELSSFTNGITAEGMVGQDEVFLLMPLAYMNNSGNTVSRVVELKGILPHNVLVICDDFNLPFKQIRLRPKGSDGGHNGLASVIERLATTEFHRLRLGIGFPNRGDVIDFVLEEFNSSEMRDLDSYLRQAVECCKMWLSQGIDKAMEQFNKSV